MKRLFFFLFAFPITSLMAQHNEVQSLYMYDAISVNPAYAGNKGALALNANYRDQWGGIKGSPKTMSVTAHLLTRSGKTGLGLLLLNDQFGIRKNLKINAIYAYKIRIRKDVLSLGVSGGIRNQGMDLDALNLHTAGDDAFMAQPRRTILPDAAFGMMFKSRHVLAGVALPNLIRTADQDVQQAANAYLSALFGIGREWKVKPSGLARYAMNSPWSFEGNLTTYYKQLLSFGFGFRNDLTGNVHIKLQLNRQLGIAYLYERSFSDFNRFLSHTHEFMINYTFDYQTNVQSPRFF